MEKQAKTLMEKFANAKILDDREYEFRVYALEKNKDGIFINPKLGITRPTPFTGDSYFVAEVDVYLNIKSGVMRYNHLFSFELGTLETELQKNDEEWAKILILPERIANALQDCYHEVAPCLKDYNEKIDDIIGIANVLYKYRGASVAHKYGI